MFNICCKMALAAEGCVDSEENEPYSKASPAPDMRDYGPGYVEDWPSANIQWDEQSLIWECANTEKPSYTTLETVKLQSEKFPIAFPTQTARCLSLENNNQDELTFNINSAYPVISEHGLIIIDKFIRHKREYGSNVEKQLYKNMSIVAFVQRLLDKRAVSFLGQSDRYLLLNGKRGVEGWNNVGKDDEVPPLVIKHCLSYDEMKISALLSVSSHTIFINNGSRNNCGRVDTSDTNVQPSGVIIGLIGTRLGRPGAVEAQEINVTIEQNTEENGYGIEHVHNRHKFRQMWAEFYEEQTYLYPTAVQEYLSYTKTGGPCRFTEVSQRNRDPIYFDNVYYKKRLSLTFDTLLLEAEARAKTAGRSAFVHVVGVGLGVWKISSHQEKVYLDVLAQRILALLPSIPHVSDIVLGYFDEDSLGGYTTGDVIKNEDDPKVGVKVTFSKRNPHERLQDRDAEKLLVVSYAWDGNALPGNEYWNGKLQSSGDPAAACSTQVAELHNPHINTTRVSGSNLHIASRQHGVIHIADYVTKYIGKDNVA